MSAPKLSNLQFLVLGILRAGPLSGRAVRQELERFDVHKSGPAFYQLMSRLEAGGLLEGSYTQEIVEGQIIRERCYTIQGAGQEAWEANRDFHLEVIRRFGPVGDSAGA